MNNVEWSSYTEFPIPVGLFFGALIWPLVLTIYLGYRSRIYKLPALFMDMLAFPGFLIATRKLHKPIKDPYLLEAEKEVENLLDNK